jgi:hypothetical protein
MLKNEKEEFKYTVLKDLRNVTDLIITNIIQSLEIGNGLTIIIKGLTKFKETIVSIKLSKFIKDLIIKETNDIPSIIASETVHLEKYLNSNNKRNIFLTNSEYITEKIEKIVIESKTYKIKKNIDYMDNIIHKVKENNQTLLATSLENNYNPDNRFDITLIVIGINKYLYYKKKTRKPFGFVNF